MKRKKRKKVNFIKYMLRAIILIIIVLVIPAIIIETAISITGIWQLRFIGYLSVIIIISLIPRIMEDKPYLKYF